MGDWYLSGKPLKYQSPIPATITRGVIAMKNIKYTYQ